VEPLLNPITVIELPLMLALATGGLELLDKYMALLPLLEAVMVELCPTDKTTPVGLKENAPLVAAFGHVTEADCGPLSPLVLT